MKPTNKIDLFASICIIAILAAAEVFAQEPQDQNYYATAANPGDFYSKPEAYPGLLQNPNADYTMINWNLVANQGLAPSARIAEIPTEIIKVQEVSDKAMIKKEQWTFGSNIDKGDNSYGNWRDAVDDKYAPKKIIANDGKVTVDTQRGCIQNYASGCQPIINFARITSLPDGRLLLETLSGKLENGNLLEGAATYGAEAGKETTTLQGASTLAMTDGTRVESTGKLTQFTKSPQETTITGQAFFADRNGKGVVGSYSDGNDVYVANGAYGQEGAKRYGLGTAFSFEQDSVGVAMTGSDMTLRAENTKLLTLMTSFASGLQRLPTGSVSASQVGETAQSLLKEVYGPDTKTASRELGYTFANAVGFSLTDTTQLRTGVSLLNMPAGGTSSILTGLEIGNFNIVNLQTNDRATYLNTGIKLDSSIFRDPAAATHLSLAVGVKSDKLGAVALEVDATQRGATGSASWNVYSLDRQFSVGVSYVHQQDFENKVESNMLQFGVGAKF